MSNVTPLVTCDRAREHLLVALPNAETPVGIEQHLRTCGECREFAATVSRLDGDLRSVMASETAPSELWPWVLRALDDEDAAAAAATARSASASDWIVTRPLSGLGFDRLNWSWRLAVGGLAAMLMMVIAVLIADPFSTHRDGAVISVVKEPVDDLITYRASQRSPDIESGNPHVVAEWLIGKIDFQQPKPIAEIGAYRLVGARLCYLLNRRLSALMYLSGDHVISLYTMSHERLDLPGGEGAQIADWKISVYEYKGYTSLVWHQGSLAFALVSDLSRSELLRIAGDLKRGWDQVRDARARFLGAHQVASASEIPDRGDFARNAWSHWPRH